MVTLVQRLAAAVADLSDEQLRAELVCAERCALMSTRTRRELARIRARCIREELQRRAERQPAGVR